MSASDYTVGTGCVISPGWTDWVHLRCSICIYGWAWNTFPKIQGNKLHPRSTHCLDLHLCSHMVDIYWADIEMFIIYERFPLTFSLKPDCVMGSKASQQYTLAECAEFVWSWFILNGLTVMGTDSNLNVSLYPNIIILCKRFSCLLSSRFSFWTDQTFTSQCQCKH